MNRTQRYLSLLSLALVAVSLLAGCRSGRRDDPILLLSAEEALEQGKDMMAREKWWKARRLLTHAFEVAPNSRTGREALLLSADTLFLHGGDENFIKCEAKYRDFLNRFPTSERADYAQYQVANCLAARMERPDRDQNATRKALEAYEELLRLYPTSEYTLEARERLQDVRDNLAEYEFVVARFYLRYRGLCIGSIQRLNYLEETYPNYTEMDKALYHLGVAYERCKNPERAEEVFARLASEFPDSPYLAEVAKEERKPKVYETDKDEKKKKRWDFIL